MGFDIEGARRAGYSDAEIVDHVAAERKFDAGSARRAGYSDAEILGHLREPIERAGTPAAPADTRGTGERAARGLGLGVRDAAQAVAALPGIAYDLAAVPLNLGIGAINALAPREQTLSGLVTGEAPKPAWQIPTIRSARENIGAVADAAGLPRAETAAERYTSAGVEGAGSVLPSLGAGLALRGAQQVPMIANALLAAPVAQVASGATGGLAAEGAREAGAGPVGQVAAALGGGLAGAAVAPAVGMAARGANALLQPFRQAGREQIVGDVLLRSSGRPETLPARVAAGAEPTVPGSVPTTAEAALDPGLAQLQRTVQSMDPTNADAFALRDASRDAARRAEAAALEPSTGGAPRVAQGVETAVAREAQRVENASQVAEGTLEQRLNVLPARTTPEAAGAAIRTELQGAHDEARQATSRAFEQIDPDGTSRIPLGPVRQAATEARGRYFGELSGGPPAELQSVVDDLAAAGDVAPWRDLQSLRARLGVLANHADPRVRSAAGQIRQAIDDTAERAAQPYELPSRPMTSDDIDAGYAAEGAAQHPDVASRLDLPDDVLGARIDAQAAPEGLSLIQFLRRQGGIRNQDDEVRTVMGTTRAMPALISGRGLTLDRAAELAWERGYLGGEGTTYTPRELLEAVDAELRGLERRYPRGEVRVRDNRRSATVEDDLAREVEARGGSFDREDPQATLRSLRQVDEAAPAAGPDGPDGFAAIDNAFTPEQAEAWRTAQAARREQGQRFDRAPVAGVLQERFGEAAMPASAVPAALFRAGGGGPEGVRQVLAAAGDRAGAVQALEAHAATSLRDYAARANGTLDPAKWQRWMQQHAGALGELPELQARLRSVGEAAAEVERVAGLARSSQLEIERGVAKYFLGRDPREAVAGVLDAADSTRRLGELRRLVAGDPEALQGLRRAYLDEWMARATTTTQDATANFRLSPATATRFARDNGGAARQLFTPAEMERIEALASDFARGAFPASAGRAAGSNTAQNLSTGNFIARASNGLIDPSNAIAQTLGSGFGLLQRLVYAYPEALTRDLLREAMLNPSLARDLLAKASPASVRRAIGYVERDMGERVREAVGGSLLRQGVRSAGTDAREPAAPARSNALGGGAAPPPRNTLLQ